MRDSIKITALILSLVLISCKKDPFDYRKKYEGDWEMTSSYSISTSLFEDNYSPDRIDKVRLVLGEKDDEILVDYVNIPFNRIFIVQKNGDLSFEEYKGSISKDEFRMVIMFADTSADRLFVEKSKISGKKL
jgi:hypothetical protein